MMGSGYVIEHCVSAFLQSRKEQAFKSYVTTALKVLTENTSKHLTWKGDVAEIGGRMAKSFDEVINPTAVPEESRTAEEIIQHIKDKLERMKDEP